VPNHVTFIVKDPKGRTKTKSN